MHNTLTEGQTDAQWPTGSSKRSLMALRGKPLHGDGHPRKRACGDSAVIFSEGRGLRVRKDWPDANRCTTCSRRGKRTPSGLLGACLGQAQAFFNGRAEPAPPRAGRSRKGWPDGGNPGVTRKVVFSEGRALRVRLVRPSGCPGISFRPHV
jgi:hypothetical protein